MMKMLFGFGGVGVVIIIIVIAAVGMVSGDETQNCGCESSGLCCSQNGYCREGPCHQIQTNDSLNNSLLLVAVADIVTPDFFNAIIKEADADCAGSNLYSRAAFLEALISYPQFGRINGSLPDSKSEIAAAFAHFTHETGHFCYIQEIDGASKDYCDESDTQYPCVPGKGYHGRGPIQLSWNFNYGPAGESNGFDGLKSPETVATDAVVAFKTALWYWMQYVRAVLRQGFGATIRAINGPLECDGANPLTVRSRLNYYLRYCSLLAVHPAHNLASSNATSHFSSLMPAPIIN